MQLGKLPKRAPPASHPRAAFSRSALRATAAVAERPQQVEIAHDVQLWQLEQSYERAPDFQDYEQAQAAMARLELLSEELQANLDELNHARDALEATPVPDFYAMQQQEARRARRAAAREARKATSTPPSRTAAVLAGPAPSPRAVPASSSPQRAASALMAAPSSPAPSSSPMSSPPTQRQHASQATTSTAVVHARPMSGPSLRLGPSLPVARSAAPASTSAMQAEPSAWAREANAKRARAGTRKATTSSALLRTSSAKAQLAMDEKGDSNSLIGLRRSGAHDLLTGVSEKELAHIVKDLLYIERVKGELKGLLSREPTHEEWARALKMDPSIFAQRLHAGLHAKSVMVQANYRLVVAICKKYQDRGMSLQDLVAEGIRGLLTGVERFDADKGFRFSTYAHWWIRQAVTRSLTNQAREVRLPCHMADLLNKIRYTRQQLTERLNREPTMAELSQRTQLTPKRIDELMAMAWQANSLDAVVGDEDSGGTIKDQLEDDRATPDETLEDTMFGREFDAVLTDLTEREAGVIRMRFGLDGEQVSTLEDIGIRLGLTRERIRQIEAKAIRKLKQKHNVFAVILQEHAEHEASGEIAARSSQGTNKQG